jgi:hypothetical protein
MGEGYMFKINITETIKKIISAPVHISTMNFAWLPFAISAGASLFSGITQKNRYNNAASAYRDASQQNAADLLHYSGLNAGLIEGAAHRNAAAIETIGEANASAVERAVARNMALYAQQAKEEVRRHIIGEKMVAGTIRAIVGSSGLMTNTGTPLRYLESTVNEGINQRQFMQEKHAQTLLTMKMEGEDRAHIYRLTARENAAVVMANAEAQIGVMMNDAQRQHDAMLRSGDMQFNQLQAQGSSAMWGGIAGAISSGIGYGFESGAFNNLFSSGGKMTAPPGIAQNTPPPMLTAPGYMGAPAPYSGSLPSWFRG